MPLQNKRGRRRRADSIDDDKDSSKLTGWDAIQKNIFSHDSDMIDDFADDIDTLLVFAGLFSAVVTAFVIVSFTMLQPDNTQLTVQLLSVLTIRSGGVFASDSFLNSTAAGLPSTTTFQAPASAITISALWFTSLVLSLASALYGILAKQWCREYIKWRYALADARENVLVRQMRYEAWERYSSGDLTVAIILTVFIGLALAIVLAATVVPVLSRRCPYRSPTGWAIVKLWEFVRRARRKPSSWRSREVNAPRILFSSYPDEDLSSVPRGIFAGPAKDWKALFDGNEVGILLRALTWVYQGPVSAPLTGDVLKCIPSLHSANPSLYGTHIEARDLGLRLYSTLRGLGIIKPEGRQSTHYNLYEDYISRMCNIERRRESYLESYVFRPMTAMMHPRPGEQVYLVIPRHPFVKHPSKNEEDDSIQVHDWIARHALMQEFESYVTLLAREPWRDWSLPAAQMALLLCLFRSHTGLSALVETLIHLSHYREELSKVLSTAYRLLGPIKDAYRSGVICMVTEVLCLTGESVKVDIESYSIQVSGHGYNPDNENGLVSFAQQVFEQNMEYLRENERHLFVIAADAVLRHIVDLQYLRNFGDFPFDKEGGIFVLMARAMFISLQKRYPNCGAYINLPWLPSLVMVVNGIPDIAMRAGSIMSEIPQRPVLQLLSLLQQSLHEQLITGAEANDQFNMIYEYFGKPELHPIRSYDEIGSNAPGHSSPHQGQPPPDSPEGEAIRCADEFGQSLTEPESSPSIASDSQAEELNPSPVDNPAPSGHAEIPTVSPSEQSLPTQGAGSSQGTPLTIVRAASIAIHLSQTASSSLNGREQRTGAER
ncbi:hypothetical protein NM688_g2880 [Phlebia brevispora]|uniref:Uncharacterized protein n=1 Tax=Phlebia brevispora TaxID=194682 RepID=A0ACC1T7H0_9APHY|nr:hypothetical protein NM688_g2880 [Phlebia brevispora]